MKRLQTMSLCAVVVLLLIAAIATNASAAVPTWFECGKAVKVGKTFGGDYTGKTCAEEDKVINGGKYELREGVSKGKAFKSKGGRATLHAETVLGGETIECSSSKGGGKPAPPNLETAVVLIYKGCKAPDDSSCNTAGEAKGEIEIDGLKGELIFTKAPPSPIVGVRLESAAHPGPSGVIVAFTCNGLEATIKGALTGTQEQNIDVVSKESETTELTGTTMDNKGEALMLKTQVQAGGKKTVLIGEMVEHNIGGDAKKEEITPIKFVATRTGTVEELFFEAGGYHFKEEPPESSLVLGIQEKGANGKPGNVLGEGTYNGTLGFNQVATVSGLKVPITKGTVYYLTFLPLGGAVTYWYSQAETILYSEHHKKLVEGLPENYQWKVEAHEAPIGMWASGS